MGDFRKHCWSCYCPKTRMLDSETPNQGSTTWSHKGCDPARFSVQPGRNLNIWGPENVKCSPGQTEIPAWIMALSRSGFLHYPSNQVEERGAE